MVCGQKLQLEVADDDNERMMGLMYRTEIKAGHGMIFIFPRAERQAFWMKNVPFDIDIGYFDARGKLLNAVTMLGTSPLQTSESLPNYPSKGAVLYAVEVPAGFYARHKKNCVLKKL